MLFRSKEEEEQISLSTNVMFGIQSVYRKDGGLTGTFTDYALAAPLMAGYEENKDMDVLMLGVGAGTYATQCRQYFGDIRVEGVEIDEKITRLASSFFHMPQDVPVTNYDGRAFLNVTDKKYDVIFVDAYQDITIPFQMSSVEFFELVSGHLTENGVMVVNLNMWEQKEGDINAHLMDTISQVFDNVYTADVPATTNLELFASHAGGIQERFEGSLGSIKDPELQNLMRKIARSLKTYEAGGHIMTDDKAPVELLGMGVIDDLIRQEVSYYRNLYEQKGLRGLAEELGIQ